jgi:hypothetical protein
MLQLLRYPFHNNGITRWNNGYLVVFPLFLTSSDLKTSHRYHNNQQMEKALYGDELYFVLFDEFVVLDEGPVEVLVYVP